MLWLDLSRVIQFNLEFRDALDGFLSDLGYNVSVVNVSASLNASDNTVTAIFSVVFNEDVPKEIMLQVAQE